MARLILCFFLSTPLAAFGLTAAESKKLWQKSLEHYNRGEFDRSRDLLLRLVRSSPSKALYWFNLGNSFFMLQYYAKAETCFAKVESLRSPLSYAARLYRAKALAAREQTEPAKRILHSLLSKQDLPQGLHDEATKDLMALQPVEEVDPVTEATSEEALKWYRAGKYRRALRVIDRDDELNDNLKMLKALILIKLDREDGAHEILQTLQNGESEEIRQLAGSLLDRIRNTYSKPKWLYVESALGQDSNIYDSNDKAQGMVLATQAGGGGRFWTHNLWYATGGYNLRWREVFDHADLRTVYNEAKLNAGREISNDLFLLSPFVLHELDDGEARRLSTGLTARWRTGRDKYDLGVDAEWTEERALDRDYHFLTGSTQYYMLYAGTILSPIYVRANFKVLRQDTGDIMFSNGDVIPYAHRAFSPGVTLLWRVKSDLAAELGFSYTSRWYPTPPSSGPMRKDKEYAVSARITKILSQGLTAYTGVNAKENKSTLDGTSVSNENFDQIQAVLGVIWDAI